MEAGPNRRGLKSEIVRRSSSISEGGGIRTQGTRADCRGLASIVADYPSGHAGDGEGKPSPTTPGRPLWEASSATGRCSGSVSSVGSLRAQAESGCVLEEFEGLDESAGRASAVVGVRGDGDDVVEILPSTKKRSRTCRSSSLTQRVSLPGRPFRVTSSVLRPLRPSPEPWLSAMSCWIAFCGSRGSARCEHSTM